MGIINGVKNPAPTPKDHTIPILVTTGVLTALKEDGALVDKEHLRRTLRPGTRMAGMALAGFVFPGTVYCLGYMLARSAQF